jgi:hypothetical protein
MSSKVNVLRWVGIPGLLLALAAVLLLITMGKGSAQSTSTETSESKRIVDVTGKVGTAVNAKGDTRYTLETDDARLWLGAGPDWYYGESEYPLEPLVGKTVTVAGEEKLDAISITSDGQTQQIRPAEGEPPWAGGPEAAGR